MKAKDFIFKILPKSSFGIWRNKAVIILSSVSLALLVLIWILWLWKMRVFGQIYSPLLTSQFLNIFSNYSLPIFNTLFFILNLFLAQKSYSREKMATFFLLGIAFFVQVLTLILIRFYLEYSF